MNTYIGTKIIRAKPMDRLAYNVLRGWTVPDDENPLDDGYLVEYVDGGKANVPGFDGYISWSPKDVFERAYKPCTQMSFGDALVALKSGKRVSRAGWNGKGMWLCLVARWNGAIGEMPVDYHLLPWIAMKTVDGGAVPWLASQTDMLSDDWQIVE